ncbi:MAG: HlyD family efflux transporter periplasmic adaptor subunit [Chromatiales bacterium]
MSGFTRERTRVVLSTEISGRVEEVNGDIGDLADAVRPFTCLDQTFIDLELDANREDRRALQVDHAYFSKEVERLRRLLARKSSSESQLDAVVRNLDKTGAQLEALKIASRTLRETKARHCIHIPEGWRIINRLVEPGEWINTGQPVVEIGDFRRLLVPFALSLEEYQALQRQGDALRLYLPQQGREVPANLLRVSPAFDEVSRKIAVELEIGEGVEDPRGGLRAELALLLPHNSGAVTVPASALIHRYEQYWLKRSDGEEVRVVYLGSGRGEQRDTVRVVSPEVKPGDRFQSSPEY